MKRNIFRFILWGAALLLSVVSFVMFVMNFRILQAATVLTEKNSAAEAKNFRYYFGEYKTTKVALDETNQKLLDLTKVLEQANNDLTQTRGELTSVQQINDQLKANIVMLERYKAKAAEKGEALESMLLSFKNKNREMDLELQGVRKELAVFQPDISDTQEGRTKVQMFKRHIHMVKQNMTILRRKANEAREVVQKEHDRLEAVYGNGGFMVKGGQDKSVNSYGQKHFDIDVKFINK